MAEKSLIDVSSTCLECAPTLKQIVHLKRLSNLAAPSEEPAATIPSRGPPCPQGLAPCQLGTLRSRPSPCKTHAALMARQARADRQSRCHSSKLQSADCSRAQCFGDLSLIILQVRYPAPV